MIIFVDTRELEDIIIFILRTVLIFSIQLFAAMLKTDKVYEKSKTRIKLQDVGYSGLTLLMGELPVTMPMNKSLIDQVTGIVYLCFSYCVVSQRIKR